MAPLRTQLQSVARVTPMMDITSVVLRYVLRCFSWLMIVLDDVGSNLPMKGNTETGVAALITADLFFHRPEIGRHYADAVQVVVVIGQVYVSFIFAHAGDGVVLCVPQAVQRQGGDDLRGFASRCRHLANRPMDAM